MAVKTKQCNLGADMWSSYHRDFFVKASRNCGVHLFQVLIFLLVREKYTPTRNNASPKTFVQKGTVVHVTDYKGDLCVWIFFN